MRKALFLHGLVQENGKVRRLSRFRRVWSWSPVLGKSNLRLTEENCNAS